MYYNDYNLYQLLEIALRVPEVGAVNFNILYYILKTIILEQNLGEIKPVFSLEVPLAVPRSVLKTEVNEVSLKRSYSDGSLDDAKANKAVIKAVEKPDDVKANKDVIKAVEMPDDAKANKAVIKAVEMPDDVKANKAVIKPVEMSDDAKANKADSSKGKEKEKDKWQKTLLFKRLDAVEEEISEIHIMIAQLVDKISNFERVSGLQETKFMRGIAELHHLLQSKEDPNFAKKFEELSSKVEMLMQSKLESEETEGSSDELASLNTVELDENKVNEFNQDESKSNDIKSVSDEADESKLDEVKPDDDMPSKTKLETQEVEIKPEPLESGTTDANGKSKKSSHHKTREKELMEKVERLIEEVNSIKEQIKVKSSHKEAQETIFDKKEISDIVQRIVSEKVGEKETVTKADVSKIDLELVNVSAEVHKAVEKCAAMDKALNLSINRLKEKNLILENTIGRHDEDLEALKANWDEMVHNFESLKENIQYIEKEMTVLTEFPGIKNRVEQIEGYVYSEYELKDSTRPYSKYSVTEDTFIAEAEVATEEQDVMIFKPPVEKVEKARAHDIQDYLSEDKIYGSDENVGPRSIPFLAVARDVVLVKDMERKRREPKFKVKDLFAEFGIDDDDDDFSFELDYEMGEKSITDLGSIREKVPSDTKVAKEHSEEKIKSTTFTSPDILEEYSQQLKGQIIVFVKKRLNDFDIQLRHNDSVIATMRNEIDTLDKTSKELGEKITFMDANFSQRAGDLAALKQMAENHQVSIVNIMHHLDRKAESYAVNQKVSRKELTVIEDRVLKLCVTASSEITKLEEKIDSSLETFNLELDKKLYTEEFELRLKFFIHKLKILENKLKDLPMEPPVLDFDVIRPVEIKKYVLSKDGTKMKQDRKNIATWSTSESIIPVLTEHRTGGETSPKTAMQIQKELELASYRDSKRYVEGAYTKIKVGRK